MCKSISMHEIVNLNLFSIIQSQRNIIRTRHPSNKGGGKIALAVYLAVMTR